MKKRIVGFCVLALVVIAIGVLAFTACNPDDITHFRLDLNHKDADYTQEYREAHNIKSRNIVKIVNKDLYKNFCSDLPKGGDMIAPSGMIFAGWYFDKNVYEGTEFSEYNWNRFQKDAAEGEKRYILYARWIPERKRVVYFDLCNAKSDYTESYREAHNGFDHRTPEFVIDYNFASIYPYIPLRQNVDFTVPSDQNFEGWFFEDGAEFNQTNYEQHFLNGQGQLKVVAHWSDKPRVYVNFSFPEEAPGSGKWFEFKSTQPYNMQVVTENFDELVAALPAKGSIIYHRFDVDTESYTDYTDGNEFATFEWRIAVFDENYNLISTLELNRTNWFAATEGLDEWQGVSLILQYTLKPEYLPNVNVD